MGEIIEREVFYDDIDCTYYLQPATLPLPKVFIDDIEQVAYYQFRSDTLSNLNLYYKKVLY